MEREREGGRERRDGEEKGDREAVTNTDRRDRGVSRQRQTDREETERGRERHRDTQRDTATLQLLQTLTPAISSLPGGISLFADQGAVSES